MQRNLLKLFCETTYKKSNMWSTFLWETKYLFSFMPRHKSFLIIILKQTSVEIVKWLFSITSAPVVSRVLDYRRHRHHRFLLLQHRLDDHIVTRADPKTAALLTHLPPRRPSRAEWGRGRPNWRDLGNTSITWHCWPRDNAYLPNNATY